MDSDFMDWMAILNHTNNASSDFSVPPPPPIAAAVPEAEQSMKEMIFCLAALQPVRINPELVKARPRRNVRISKDPQSVAARQRRERIGERIRILQQLVPGGTKMDTASMLEEAARYLKFLKAQVRALGRSAAADQRPPSLFGDGVSYFLQPCTNAQLIER